MRSNYQKSYTTEAAVAAYLIVKPGASGGVVPAAAATDALLGVNDSIDLGTGQTGDIALIGVSQVKLGGAVAVRDPLTSNATGQAIKAVPAAGANANIIGFALSAGASGDVIEYIAAPGSIQG